MYKLIAYTILTTALFLSGLISYGQKNNSNPIFPLSVGDTCPDLTFDAVINYPKSSLRLSDFQKKDIILDFWFVECVPCLRMIPVVDSLQSEFKDKLQFIPITWKQKSEVLKCFERIPGDKNRLSVVEERGKIYDLFFHKTEPHYVWLDSNRVVRAITGQESITTDNIAAFVSNKQMNLNVKTTVNKVPLKHGNPLLLNGNGDYSGPIFSYSIITGYIDGEPSFVGNVTPGRFISINCPILALYLQAYAYLSNENSGYFFPISHVVLNVKDTLRYTDRYHKDRMTSEQITKWNKENLYCYNLILPEEKYSYILKPSENWKDLLTKHSSKEYKDKRTATLKVVLEELTRKFGLTAKVENREVNCLVLKCKDTALLKSKYYSTVLNSDRVYYLDLQHAKVSDFLENFRLYWFNMIPIADETNFSGYFDIEISGKMNSLPFINQALNKYGLEFVKAKRKMDVLVFSDGTMPDK